MRNNEARKNVYGFVLLLLENGTLNTRSCRLYIKPPQYTLALNNYIFKVEVCLYQTDKECKNVIFTQITSIMYLCILDFAKLIQHVIVILESEL